MITAKLITEAYVFLRTNNHSIPDEVLDFMKDVSLAALDSQNSGKPIVSGSLPQFLMDEIFTAAGTMVDKFPEVEPEVVKNIFVHGAQFMSKWMKDKLLGGNDR